MGIFDWLKKPKSNVELLDDQIWLTKQAKFAGISTATGRCLAGPGRPLAVLWVAHYHVSLEDAVMRAFAGEWVQRILQQLGMKETEAIESRMVGRRIQQATRKIEQQAVSDLRADSAEEWLKRNCPAIRDKLQDCDR